jgi:hypothetical protein
MSKKKDINWGGPLETREAQAAEVHNIFQK